MNNELKTFFDHLVVGSYYLRDGVNFIQQQLGIMPETGGKHVSMGTHNQLINLHHAAYFELIAIDPDLPSPQHPRWFGLDVFNSNDKPKLITWVVRTNNIEEAVKKSPFQYGEIITMQRGNYQWQITIPQDGSMPLNGLAPTIIQWHGHLHPSQNLSQPQLSLIQIEVCCTQAQLLKNYLASIGFNDAFNIVHFKKCNYSQLTAMLQSPKGVVEFKNK